MADTGERLPLRVTGAAPGHIDEIVGYGLTSIQLEQMTDCSWFLCIVDGEGNEFRFDIGAKNNRSPVRCILLSGPEIDNG